MIRYKTLGVFIAIFVVVYITTTYLYQSFVSQTHLDSVQFNSVTKTVEVPSKVELYFETLSYQDKQLWLTELNRVNFWRQAETVKASKPFLIQLSNLGNLAAKWALINWYLQQAYYEQAIQVLNTLDNAKAYAQLANIYLQQNKPEQAYNKLKQAVTVEQNIYATEFVQLAIKLHKPLSEWLSVIESAAQQDVENTNKLKPIYANYLNYFRNSYKQMEDTAAAKPESCQIQLNLVVTHPNQLTPSKNKIKQSLANLQIERWFDCPLKLHWSIDSQIFQKIEQTKQINQYWILVRDTPRAYRYQNTISLLPNFNLSLLQHEMSHWFEFEDEYELAQEKAESRCYMPENQAFKQAAPNILLVNPKIKFSTKSSLISELSENVAWIEHIVQVEDWITKDQGFRLKILAENKMDQGVGFYQADTCNLINDVIAVKPLINKTFMQNYAEYIPKMYKEMMHFNGTSE